MIAMLGLFAVSERAGKNQRETDAEDEDHRVEHAEHFKGFPLATSRTIMYQKNIVIVYNLLDKNKNIGIQNIINE